MGRAQQGTIPVRQASFAGGEIAPGLQGRTDVPRYAESLAMMRNVQTTRTGAAINRAGTKWCGEIKDSTRTAHYIPFAFSDGQVLALEFGNLYVRFWSVSGAPVVDGGGIPIEVITPWLVADLPRLKYAQFGDVTVLVHPSYQPRKLTRVSNTVWTLALYSTQPQAWWGTNFKLDTYGYASQDLVGGTASWDPGHQYKAGEYALADAIGVAANLTGCVFMAAIDAIGTKPGDGATDTSHWWILAIDATRPPQVWVWAITVLWRDSSGVLHESRAGVCGGGRYSLYADRPAKLTWTAPGAAGAPAGGFKIVGYNIYRGRDSFYGFVGGVAASATSWTDRGDAPDFTIQPPRGDNPFSVADGTDSAGTTKYPGAVAFHQGRIVFGRSDAKPGTIMGSRVGEFDNFDRNFPVVDSNAYEWTVEAHRLEEIRSLVSLRQLLLLTGQSEFSATGLGGDAITPSGILPRRHSGHGSAYLDPVTIGQAILYAQTKGNTVRDLFYDFQSDSYTGSDLSVFASHLLDGHTITAWCYAEVPNSTIFAVRDDGVVLSLTYVREQQMVAWAHHHFPNGDGNDAVVEDICAVPDTSEDAVFLLVKRTLPDGTKRYVEKLASRKLPLHPVTGKPDDRFAVYLDCALTSDGRNTDPTNVKRVVSASGYSVGADVTIYSLNNDFAPTDVDATSVVFDPDGAAIAAKIVGYTDANTVTAELQGDLSVAQIALWSAGAGTSNWAFARTRFSWTPFTATPLACEGTKTTESDREGQIGALADGSVLWDGDANTRNGMSCAGGIVTLDVPAVVVTVGISFNADVELLDIADGKTRVKGVERVSFETADSRGLWAGESFEDEMKQWVQRSVEDSYSPVALANLIPDVEIESDWNRRGRAVLRQADPLPMTLLSVTRQVSYGGSGTD